MHKKMSKQRLIIALFTVLMPLFAFSQEVDEEYGNIGGEASQLTFPNAFSPNGDEINDLYQAKTCQNIVEFRATIINRWGHKLYEWSDPAGGWDGTSGGRNVADGVYFVIVKAKGADGKDYHIRKDVNLLRGHSNQNR